MVYETTPFRSMCSRTLPSTRRRACRSSSIWARLDRSTILICLDGLFFSPFYPWFRNRPLRIFRPSCEATCPVFMLARGWNCRAFRPVGLFIWKISIASCHSKGWPCIFSPSLFWKRLIVWHRAFSGFRGICYVPTQSKAAVFMTWNRHLWFPWGWPWFKEMFNWVFE